MAETLVEAIAVAIRSVAKRTQTMAITEESLLVEDLKLDSLDLVGVLMKLEDRYGLQIEVDEVPNLRTVAELAAHVATLLGDQAAAA